MGAVYEGLRVDEGGDRLVVTPDRPGKITGELLALARRFGEPAVVWARSRRGTRASTLRGVRRGRIGRPGPAFHRSACVLEQH